MMGRLKRLVVGGVLASVLGACTGPQGGVGENGTPSGPLELQATGSFFVGGRNLRSASLSQNPSFPADGTITVDQTYVQYMVPAGEARGVPIVLVHGCCLTGKTWETTPDGRMGWYEYLTRMGHPTYVVDQAGRGRSAWNPSPLVAVRSGRAQPGATTNVFAAAQEAAWVAFRFGDAYPQVYEGQQFPLAARDEFFKQMVPDLALSLGETNPTVPALSILSQRLGGALLVSHSQSGIYPFQAAAMSGAGIRGIVSIEPGACPDANASVNAYLTIPTMVLFGDYVDRSPRWAPRLAACRAFAEKVRAQGGRTEVVVLPEIGIRGNSHMLMQDKNSLEIAAWLERWITRHVGQRG